MVGATAEAGWAGGREEAVVLKQSDEVAIIPPISGG